MTPVSHLLSRVILGALVGVGAAVAMAAVPASAAVPPTPGAAVLIAPARLELPVINEQPVTRTLTIASYSSQPETVSITAVDFTITADGSYAWLPSGATPWSMTNALTVSGTARNLDIKPGGNVKVQVTYMPVDVNHLRASALVFTPTLLNPPTRAAGDGAAVKMQAIVPVLAVPAGSDGKLDGRTTLAGTAAGLSFPDGVTLGPITFMEPGTLRVSGAYRNVGNVYARLDPWTSFANFGRVFANVESAPQPAMPGQTARYNTSPVLNLPGQGNTDLTPTFCLCEVRSSGRFVLLGSTSAEASQSRWVVIAPFRILGVAAAVLGGIWYGVRQARRERVRRRMLAEYLAEPDES